MPSCLQTAKPVSEPGCGQATPAKLHCPQEPRLPCGMSLQLGYEQGTQWQLRALTPDQEGVCPARKLCATSRSQHVWV